MRRLKMKTISALLAFCEGNPTVTGDSPHKGHESWALRFSLLWARTSCRTNNTLSVIWVPKSTYDYHAIAHVWFIMVTLALMLLLSLTSRLFVQNVAVSPTGKPSKPCIIGLFVLESNGDLWIPRTESVMQKVSDIPSRLQDFQFKYIFLVLIFNNIL